ncbi:hypothetical protein L2E82_02783 [Cichorium intybus]|uniref:Uncharacterized protein n=1 Tax=Cichorium intybus TaxID=13427 RepID=A0ACB9H2M1_CICIN|nr:hypothetical protein L2E82_02783 [Cichorium intybus]
MASLTCTNFTLLNAAAILLQITGLSLFVFGFFPIKPALSGVRNSGRESFRSSSCDSIEDQNLTAVHPDQLKSLYQLGFHLVTRKVDEIGFPGVPVSKKNMEGVDTTKLNALDVLPHEVGVVNLLTTNGISPCDNYLIDIGYVDHGASIDYIPNEGLHVGNSSLGSPFPMFCNKGNFGIQNSLTDSIPESECQSYFLGNIFRTKSKTVDNFEDYSKSFIDQEDDERNLPLHFQTG